jgi:hypothetical protein
LATLYLMSQLEFIFRMKSRYLDGHGAVLQLLPIELLKKLSRSRTPHRINQINDAFIIYLYRTPTPLAVRLRKLERQLAISDRLGLIRNPAMHGLMGDPAVEGRFLGLVLSMFYYDEHKT